ncbi:membrane integrity-associated transporter subunit PqiC [Gluconobacter sp.]|uniref:PqiC family protein n=1 Tax=Gluconobacter sp. TaxID=1876758 RepID=UPI0039E9266C
MMNRHFRLPLIHPETAPVTRLMTRSAIPCALLALALLSGCAAPPMQFYTLGAPAIAQAGGALPATAPVLNVSHVTLPDYLDNQDILTRRGDQLDRSPNGRWGSRLSQGVTDLLAAHLGQDWPGYVVTTQPLAETPSLRLAVNISRLDLDSSGQGALAADWALIPADEHQPVLRNRGSFTAQGTVATDGGKVALTRTLVEQLAARIAGTPPHS